ncbi:MAG: SCP2 sterol-binding domain-containing protein, partial [Chloroflexi bacterium]|nr:SCP2 sterol-binding domain-containing protein [Chloroflexota bacterium]
GGFTLEPSTSDKANVTLSVSASDYILLLTGRLPMRRMVRRGRVRLEGDEDLAYMLGDWFRPVHTTTLP